MELNDNFYKWFGNSKVVKNGKPLIVYHGSPIKFDEFKPQLMNYGSISNGFCFFSNKRNAYPNCAADYAGKNGYIYDCYLRIERPLHVRYGNTPEEYYHTPIHYWDTCQSDIRREFRKGNYDGIIIENLDSTQDDSVIYLVPNANQIKSIYNNGNWSDNSNIYESNNITTNTLGQEIKNPEKFWKWFDDSILVDKQGRPLVFYHGTRNDFTEFKSNYSDQLIFFSYEKEFADDWGKSKKEYDTEISNEISDLVSIYKNKLFKEYQAKYGDEFYMETEPPRNKPYNEYRQKVDEYEQKLEQERNVHTRTLGCYLKAHKLFIPEKDYELVLDEIFKYYDWVNPYTEEYETKLQALEDEYDLTKEHWDKWWAENKNAEEETIKAEESKLDNAYKAYSEFKRIKDRRDYDLNRIKNGAWVYFEHGNVIDKIYELGYDAIQLSEREGKQTTIAVRPNQIKSIDNNGEWSKSNNIYEDLQDLIKLIQRAEL